MTFHKEGYPSIILVLIVSAIINYLTHTFLSDYPWATYLGYTVSTFLIIVILQFFRSPNIKVTPNDNHIISPCDGKVVVIEEVQETEFINEKRIQVSIFMSPINVHNNRYPIAGTLKNFKYHPGKFLVAWHPKSSTENERTSALVEDSKGRSVLFRQIAGALARRIVFYGKEGDKVEQGSECGFIKFGSRVDLFLPIGTKINVALEQKVTGGIDVIGEFQ
ncbi:phosphatidylserine decarboxylase family protein [Vicingaceae bacterium]|jgi:phosphatidylserine decarboxylase|nr:phosphatidylserine decarboxylase family protein [Vicingaceae bacterium]